MKLCLWKGHLSYVNYNLTNENMPETAQLFHILYSCLYFDYCLFYNMRNTCGFKEEKGTNTCGKELPLLSLPSSYKTQNIVLLSYYRIVYHHAQPKHQLNKYAYTSVH